MQIVIDIPEEVKHKVYAYGLSLSPSDKEQLIKAIMNGTPLDKLRAEIADTFIKHGLGNTEICFDVLQIIDKYRGIE